LVADVQVLEHNATLVRGAEDVPPDLDVFARAGLRQANAGLGDLGLILARRDRIVIARRRQVVSAERLIQ
jgi:hypothetical protein